MAGHDHRSCEEIARELNDQLDGECSFVRRLKLRLHLWMCPPCKRGHRALERTVALLRSMPDEPCVDIGVEEEESG